MIVNTLGPLILSAWHRSPGNPLDVLRRKARSPALSQRHLLRRLLIEAEDTDWGRHMSYRELARSPDVVGAYQSQVPLQTYDRLKPWMSRVRSGESDVLWKGRTRHFSISSGTTSDGKIIPVSREMLRRFAVCALTVSLQYASTPDRARFAGGKILSLPGGVSPDPLYPDALVGEVSGLMAMAQPRFLASRLQALPSSLMVMEDLDRKLTLSARLSSKQDVRAIVMVPTWSTLLFDRVLENGSYASIRDVWPNLRVFFSGGVSLASYRSLLEKYLGSEIHLLESYSASEGFFGFQDDPSGDDLALQLNSGVFYEFVRSEEIDAEHPARQTLETVECGISYALFVSTCSGLWAYGVDDIIQFTSTSPPRIRVVGRTVEMLDRYGEAVRAADIRASVAEACRKTGAIPAGYHVSYTLTFRDLPRHELLIEYEREPGDLDAFVAVLDADLQARNRHYRIRREPGAMPPPLLTVLPRGTVRRCLETSHPRVGAQSKLLVVAEERRVADALTRLAFATAQDLRSDP